MGAGIGRCRMVNQRWGRGTRGRLYLFGAIIGQLGCGGSTGASIGGMVSGWSGTGGGFGTAGRAGAGGVFVGASLGFAGAVVVPCIITLSISC